MNKYFDLSKVTLDETGGVQGRDDSIRELEDIEIQSVSGGNNQTIWCDGSSGANDACINMTGCSDETNQASCSNLNYCDGGSNAGCDNGFYCEDTKNSGGCSNDIPFCS